MIPKWLLILWYPIVLGSWYSIWVFLTPGMRGDQWMLFTAQLCALVGVFWVVTVYVLRRRNRQKSSSDDRKSHINTDQQAMFDTIFYPLLVVTILSLLNLL